MAEKDFNGGDTSGNPAVPVAPRPRKKRRLILKLLAIVIVGLIVLVLALPTVLSMGPVVSMVLGQVNKQLNGKVEVSSLSLGWFTGVKIDGVRVTDASGTQIAEMDHAVVPYPLWKAITGNLSLGEIVLEGVSFDAKVDAAGQLNFAQLVKPSEASAAPASPPANATESKPSKLPNISTTLKLSNCRGTFSQAGKPTVYLTKLDGEIKIPDINQPISDEINAAIKLDNQTEGTVAISGTAAVINQNQIAMNAAEVHQTILVQNLDLQTIQPLIPTSVGVDTLQGTLGVHLSLDITGGKNLALDSAITAIKPIAFGGKILQGDIYKTNTFTASIPKLTAVFPDGLDHWQSGRITVGAVAGSSPILLKVDQGQVTAIADLTPQAILNVIARQKPGSDGRLVVTSSFDLARIIPQLRHSIPEPEGVIIDSAGLTENLKLVLTPQQAQLINTADSTDVTGTQKLANGQTKPLSISAIHLSVSGTDLGGGGALPNLHGLSLKLQSSFANGDFQGESLSDLHGTLTANLQMLQSEVSPFVDLRKRNLSGNLTVDVTGQGKLTESPYRASLKATVGLQDLKYADATGPRMSESMVRLVASANLQGSEKSSLESASDVSITLKVGDANAPTVDVLAEAPSINLVGGATGAFTLSHVTSDLSKLQKELAAVPAGQAGMLVDQGVLSMTSAGQLIGHGVSVDSMAINADRLSITRQLSDGTQVHAINGDAVHMNLVAGVNITPSADGKTSSTMVQLKNFTSAFIADQAGVPGNVATASITGATISLSAKSALDQLQSAHWQVDVADIKPIMDLVNVFSPPVAAPAETTDKPVPPLEITSGAVSLNGDISHGNSTLDINVNDVSAKNIQFHRGEIQYAAKPIDLKMLMVIQEGDGKQLLDQIRQVQITQLNGNLGIAMLSMPTPVSISQLSSNPVAAGGVQLAGNLTDLTQLLAAVQGETPYAYPYRGDYTLSENISTQQGTITLKGGMQIARFQSFNGTTMTFNEDLLTVGNDLSVAMAGDDESVTITSLTAAMQSSGAANLSLKNGSIAHLQSTRDMQLQLNVNYDLAKLWPIVQPMMGDKYKTLKIAGQFQKQFNVTGSYPANVPSTVAIKTLHADGDLAVASFDYDGLNLQNFVQPFTLDKGILVTNYANKPAGQNTAAPAMANGGTLDLSNLSIDLTQSPPHLTSVPNKVLISQVSINPVFAGSILANIIDNPLFANAEGATGQIDLTLDDCTDLPLDSAPATGVAHLHFSITKLNIGLGADALQSILKAQSFEADVKNGTVSVARGILTEHINFSTGEYVLSFDGNVRLKDQAFAPMTLGFPLAIIASKTHLADANTVTYLPDRLNVPVQGTVSHPKYRFDKTVPKAVADAATKALAGGLLGGKKNGGGDNSNPLGGFLKGLEKKNKQQNDN